jgi:hypothetical protein
MILNKKKYPDWLDSSLSIFFKHFEDIRPHCVGSLNTIQNCWIRNFNYSQEKWVLHISEGLVG